MFHSAKRRIRVGAFYDGNHFDLVRKYYMHQHKKNAWISVRGLHDYIRYRVSVEEGVDVRDCEITDAHYFRGRFSAQQSVEKAAETLYNERAGRDQRQGRLKARRSSYRLMQNGPATNASRAVRIKSRERLEPYFPPTLCNVVHFPPTTLYSVIPPFFRSPFESYARCFAVTPCMSVFARNGRYFAGSVELAAFIALNIAIAPS